MELYDFNKLSIDGKAEFTWKHAWIIESIKEGDGGFSLYPSENFFIEVEFSEKEDDIVSIRALKNRKIIEKYVDGVELEKLF